MKQQRTEQSSRSGRRIVLGALAAVLVLGGAVLHQSAQPVQADCLSTDGATITFGTGNGSCTSAGAGDSAAVAQSSSVSSSTSGSTTNSTTVVATSSGDGSATAAVQSTDGSAVGTPAIQGTDGTSSSIGVCPPDGSGTGQTLVIGAGSVCATSANGQLASPNAGSTAVSTSGSPSCGSPSMVLGPAGISFSSGTC